MYLNSFLDPPIYRYAFGVDHFWLLVTESSSFVPSLPPCLLADHTHNAGEGICRSYLDCASAAINDNNKPGSVLSCVELCLVTKKKGQPWIRMAVMMRWLLGLLPMRRPWEIILYGWAQGPYTVLPAPSRWQLFVIPVS